MEMTCPHFDMATQRYDTSAILAFILILTTGLVMSTPVWAQTGPGGVGTTDGSSNLRIWLRADKGVSPTTEGNTVTEWLNQAGYGNPSAINGSPTYQANVVGEYPAIRFDDADPSDGYDEFIFSSAFNDVGTDENTLVVVSANSGEQLNQAMIGFGDIGDSGAPGSGRGLLYDFDNQTANIDVVLAAVSGDAKGTGSNKLQTGDKAVSISYNTSSLSIFSSIVKENPDAGGDGGGQGGGPGGKPSHLQDLLANGELLDDGDASTGISGEAFVGRRVIGDIAEVIAVDRRLNAAERTILHNYLSTKYGITLEGDVTDVYGYDDSYPGDVVGVGNAGSAIQNAGAGSQTTAQSSGLRLEVGSQLNGGEYALYGHDQANLAFTDIEPPNDRSNIQKLAREWRVDMTNRSSLTGVTMGFDEDILDESSLTNSEKLSATTYNDYFLYVDDDGDFSDGDAVAYDLADQGNGLYSNPSITVNDGDYVTVARIQRTITFTQSLESGFEDTAGNVSVTAEINFKNSAALDVPYSIFGVVKSIDGASTNLPSQGDDYTATSGSFTFASGATSNSQVPVTVIDDGDVESTTEFLGIGFVGLSEKPITTGAITQFDFGIIDDDNSRPVAFASGYPTSVDEGNSGTKTQTFTVELPSGGTGPARILYNIEGTATAGEDYDIVSESDPSATTGSVTIPSGTQTGTFDIDVLGDEIDEGNETLDITLIGATDATIENSSDRSLTFTINDDDPTPEISFTSSSFAGTEGQSVDLTVELEAAAGRDLEIAFQDDGTGDATGGGTDYTFPASPTITIPVGETQGTFSIPLASDGTVEPTETIGVSIDLSGTEPPVPDSNNPPATTASILDASGLGSTGPGGVGSSDNVLVWLQSDKGLSGSSISTWPDQSGNGNDASQNASAEQPAYGSTTINGINVVTFDGTDDFLRTNVESLPGGSNTLFSVSSTNSAGTVFGIDEGSFNSLRTLEYTNGSTAAASQNGSATGGAGGAGGAAVLSSTFDGSNVNIRVNGGAATSTTASTNTNGVYAILGGEPDNAGSPQDPDLVAGNPFSGDLGEFAAYSTTLNLAQRLIVTNYLGAKYAVNSLTVDLYAGDLGADGTDGTADDRDTDVLGVGQASDGSKHFRATGGGLTISVAGDIDNEEFVLAGRKIGVEQRINVSDIGGVSGQLSARLNDDRYIDITDNDGTDGLSVDLTFDFDQFGVRGPAGDVSDYVLIRRDGTTGDWVQVSTSGVSSSGSTVTFASVSLSDADDGYFTIGTTDYVESPLDTRFTAVSGQAGTAPNNTGSNSNGADAGYLDLGLPITGGQASSIVRPDGSQLFTSTTLGRTGLNSSTGVLYTWDYASQKHVQVTDPSTSLPNGEGFLVWVKDSPEFPVDPELIFGLNDLSNEPTGNVSKSVGDQSGRYVFFANPYLSAYDMTAFTNLASNGFQSTIASWDPDNGGTYGSYVVKTQGTSGDVISRYQGFFLERTSTGAGATGFTFDVTGKITNREELLVGAKSTPAKPQTNELEYRRLALRLGVMNDSGTEIARDVAASVIFLEAGSRNWDAYDAPKYRPPSNRFATIAPIGTGRDGSQVPKSQESRTYTPGETLEIPLELRTKNLGGTFVLSARQFENIPRSWELTIVDTKGTTDPADDERVSFSHDQHRYAFEVASTKQVADGASPPVGPQAPVTMRKQSPTPRFVLWVDPTTDAPLPVELSKLQATADGRDVLVKWATASETNNAGFAVERRTEDGAFEKIGFVEGRGTTEQVQQYQYRVSNLDFGQHTFRLRQVDTDGSESLSKEVSAKLRLDEAYRIGQPYPNPTQDRSTLKVAVREAQDLRIEMYDLLGRRIRVLHDGRVDAQETQRVQINGNRLSSGHYFLRVIGDTFVETRRVTLVR